MPRRSPVLLLVHVVWATRGRRPLLPLRFDAALAAILGHKAGEVGCVLLAAGCASDHVHVVVRLAPTARLADLVQRLKGGAAHDINHPALLPHRLEWQEGYWAESLAPEDRAPLEGYLRRQREHHDDSHPAERWQFGDVREPARGL